MYDERIECVWADRDVFEVITQSSFTVRHDRGYERA